MAKKKAKKKAVKKKAVKKAKSPHHHAKKILANTHPDILKDIIRRLGG